LRAAYEKAEEAIREILALESDDSGDAHILNEWIVVAAEQFYRDDESYTKVACIFPPEIKIPYYRLLGLLEYAAARIRKDITDDDDS
jgi:hypothetical protein